MSHGNHFLEYEGTGAHLAPTAEGLRFRPGAPREKRRDIISQS